MLAPAFIARDSCPPHLILWGFGEGQPAFPKPSGPEFKCLASPPPAPPTKQEKKLSSDDAEDLEKSRKAQIPTMPPEVTFSCVDFLHDWIQEVYVVLQHCFS